MAHLPEIGAYAVLRGTQQFVADAFRVERALGGMNAATSSLGADSVRHFNRAGGAAAAFGVAVSAGLAIGTTALIGAGVAAKNVAADFEESLAFIGSITQESSGPIVALSRNIDDLSTQGTFGLRKLGEAAAELARGGLTLQDLSEGALQTAQNFAIAARGELELADAAEVVATGIQTFNLAANEANRITDSITGVAQRSTASFRDLGVSFRYAAPGAVGLNITVEELSATLGVLADGGIRGSRAGTALRQVFTTLVDPPKEAAAALAQYNISLFDSVGAVRPWRDVLVDLQKNLGPQAVGINGLTEAQRQNALATIFTQNAYSAVNQLLNRGVGEYDKMRDAILEVSAAEVAADLLTTTNNRTKIFQANVESAANAIGTSLLPAFNGMITAGIDIAQTFRLAGLALQALTGGDAGPLFAEFEKTGIGDSLLPVLDVLVTIGETIETQVIPPVQAMIATFQSFDFSPIINAIGNSFQNLGRFIAIAGQAFNLVFSPMAEFLGLANETGEATRGIAIAAAFLEAGLNILGATSVAVFSIVAAGAVASGLAIATLAAGFFGLRGRLQDFADSALPAFANLADNMGAHIQTAISFSIGLFDQFGETINQFAQDLQTNLPAAFGNLFTNIVALTGAGFDAVGTIAQDSLNQIIQLFDDLGISIRPAVESIGNAFGAIGEFIGFFFSQLGTGFRELLDAVGGFKDELVGVGNSIISTLAPAFEIVIDAIKPFAIAIGLSIAAGVLLVKMAVELAGVIGNLGKSFQDSFNAAAESIGKSTEFITEAFGSVGRNSEELSENTTTAFENVASIVGEAFSNLGSIIEEFIGNLGKFAAFLGESFGRSFGAAGEVITELWTELWNNVGTILANAGNALGTLFQAIWTGFTSILTEFIDVSFVNIRFFLSGMGNAFASAGTSLNNIWLSVWNGMIDIIRQAINTMSGMINSFLSALAATPVGQFVGGLTEGFAALPGAVGGAIDAAGVKMTELSDNVNTTINTIRTDIESNVAGIQGNFATLTSAAQGFNFQMPALEAGTRRAGNAIDDLTTSTQGGPGGLSDGLGKAGKAAKGAAKDIVDLAEAFDIAANKLRQRVAFIAEFGEVGAKAAAALSDAILLRTPQNADKAVDSLFDIIDAMREAGIPNFLELGDDLIAAFREAIVDGTPGAVSAALEMLQQLATEVGLAGKLTVDSFAQSFDRARLSAAVGKEADTVMKALNKAFVDGSKKNVDALSEAALSYIEALRKNFPPEVAAQYAEDVMSALNRSIEEGSGEFLFAVFNEIAVDLTRQGRLTAESFINSFNAASTAAGQRGGAKLIEAIVKGITEGGAQNIAAIGDTAFSIVESFYNNLSVDNARALSSSFMSQLQTTIADGSPAAIAQFGRFVTGLNQQADELKLAEKIADQFKKADEAIRELLDTSAAQDHIDNLRDALRVSQDIALDIFQTGQEAAAINRRRDQEDDDVNRSRQRSIEDEEENHQKRLREIKEKARKKTTALVTLTGGFTKSAGAGDDEFKEERKRHQERLVELEKEFSRADEDRIRKRTREDADREYTKEQETKMRAFREEQSRVLDKFNDNLEIERQIARIAKIEETRDAAIKALNVENDVAKELYGVRYNDFSSTFVIPVKNDLDHLFDGIDADVTAFIARLHGLNVTISVTKNEKPEQEEQENPEVGKVIPGGVSKAHGGGVVKGVGEKLIIAMGGETILPTHHMFHGAQPVAPSINQSNIVNNNLTVNANYAQTQSPVQVKQDMNALIMLAGGR